MEKENKKMKSHLLKKEKARLNKLVERARNNDPRIIKHENEEREKREQRKLEIEAQKKEKREKEEAIKQQKIERKLKKERDEVEKKEKAIQAEKNKRMAKKEMKKTIIKLYTEKVNLPQYTAAFLQVYLDSVKPVHKEWIYEALSSEEEKTTEQYQELFLEFIDRVRNNKKTEAAPAKVEEKKKEKTEIDKWSKQDIEKVTKAFIKFPAGVGNRWEKIALYVGGNKKIADVVKLSKELATKNLKSDGQLVDKMEKVIQKKEDEDNLIAGVWT